MIVPGSWLMSPLVMYQKRPIDPTFPNTVVLPYPFPCKTFAIMDAGSKFDKPVLSLDLNVMRLLSVLAREAPNIALTSVNPTCKVSI